MGSSIKGLLIPSLLSISLALGSASSLARGFGGGGDFHVGGDQGFHQDNGYHDNVYHDDGYVGNYHPGNGYGDPVILNAGDGGSDCQSVQQCDSDGNCTTEQNCD